MHLLEGLEFRTSTPVETMLLLLLRHLEGLFEPLVIPTLSEIQQVAFPDASEGLCLHILQRQWIIADAEAKLDAHNGL